MLAEVNGAVVHAHEALLEHEAGIPIQGLAAGGLDDETEFLAGIDLQAHGKASPHPDGDNAGFFHGGLESRVLLGALHPVTDALFAALLHHGQGAGVSLGDVGAEVAEFAADLFPGGQIGAAHLVGDVQRGVPGHWRTHACQARIPAGGVLVAQAVGGDAELVAGDANLAALVVEVVFALVEALALDGQGSLAILLGVEFGPFKYISLPLAHDRVVVKVNDAWQAAFGAMK